MAANILITGGSGYLGGTLLKQLKDATDLPSHGTIYALVRSDEQADKVTSHFDAQPLQLDLSSQDDITQTLLSKEISVVFFLIDAFKADTQLRFIEALAAVKKKLGTETHFLHTSGAKIFSSHTGHPIDRTLSDMEEGLFDIQKTSNPPFPILNSPLNTNNVIIEAAERQQTRSYIFIPCIVYGKGTGFGNPISIQTVAIIRAAKKLRRVYKVDQGTPIWPVCHVEDTASLYTKLLHKILGNEELDYNRQGYYLAASGHVAWDDLYVEIAKALAKRGLVDDAIVQEADDQALEQMGEALGCGKELVPVQLGGKCTLTAHHGARIGWVPQYRAEHILEAAEAETELVLQNI